MKYKMKYETVRVINVDGSFASLGWKRQQNGLFYTCIDYYDKEGYYRPGSAQESYNIEWETIERIIDRAIKLYHCELS